MDLYIMDENLRRTSIVDVYQSLIWTERYSEYGDIELVVLESNKARSSLPIGTNVSILESSRIMTIETVEREKDDDGNDTLKFTGRSLEAVLDNRVAMPALASLATRSTWDLTGLPQDIATEMFDTICLDGDLSSYDSIPFLQPGTVTPAGNIAFPIETITVNLDPDTLYNSIKKVCDLYNLGFRLVWRTNNTLGDYATEIFFEVYTGDNRTSAQELKAAVIFGEKLDSLSNIKELTSVAGFKNVAYVFAKNGWRVVYANNIDPTIAGLDRRVLIVDANDIDLAANQTEGSPLQLALEQRGQEELANCRVSIAFDGEIPQNSSYKYGRDYNLGDLVELRSSDGKVNNMRVTEQIFVSDKEGVRSYPTLAFDLLITPGSWLAWESNQYWADVAVDSSHEWSDI